ncbi:pilus assembly protein TadG-related protein [Streptomyces sannanensis]|uniref:Pilus assembly protein TadG-related protein n=1 Tax=Streptomyces sannanensis TaxID=285536 RepID=A0ABP6SF78_9ACTN
MPNRSGNDRGQTIPIYVAVVGGLLFLAFAYFAVAQAAATRNGAQSAADAAALAAAQDVRDELFDGFTRSIGKDESWTDWLLGDGAEGTGGAAAAQLAGENDADLTGFAPTEVNGYPAFRADVETRYTSGKSIVPGTDRPAKAHATAVIEPRCNASPEGDSPELIEFDCKGEHWQINPKKFIDGDLPEAKDLFSVYLAE